VRKQILQEIPLLKTDAEEEEDGLGVLEEGEEEEEEEGVGIQ